MSVTERRSRLEPLFGWLRGRRRGRIGEEALRETLEELIETITHLAFYTGWPSAVTAIGVAREIFEKK